MYRLCRIAVSFEDSGVIVDEIGRSHAQSLDWVKFQQSIGLPLRASYVKPETPLEPKFLGRYQMRHSDVA